jgi:multiple sugar transport system ATP-binding protein
VIQQVGDPLDLYDDPDNLFVAGFLGNPTMNFINCTVEAHGNEFSFRTEQVEWPVRLPASNGMLEKTKGRVILGIRPEDITVNIGDQDEETPCTSCMIEVVEHMGSVNLIYVNVEGNRMIVTTETALKARSGDHATLSFNPIKVHLFDAETEQKIRD